MKLGRNATRAGVVLAALTIGSIVVAQRQGDFKLDELPEILRKAIRASTTLRYSGERTVELRDGANRIRNREIIWKDGTNVRIEYGEGSTSKGQVIVERGTKRFHFFPDRNEIHVMLSRREDVVHRLIGSVRMAKEAKGKISVEDGDSIAGLRSSKVSFRASNGRIFQSIWVEPRSGLILKRELYDPAGGRMGYFEFQRVNLNPAIRSEDFEIRVPGAKVLTQTDLAVRLMKQNGFAKTFLEEKEEFVLEGVRVVGDDKILALHYRTAQGVVSLMQLKSGSEEWQSRKSRFDKERTFAFQRDGRKYLLIGPYTTAELQAFSQRAYER